MLDIDFKRLYYGERTLLRDVKLKVLPSLHIPLGKATLSTQVEPMLHCN